MVKNILKCSIFVLLAAVIVACHQDDHHWRDNNHNASANCYRNGHNVSCHKN